MKKEGLKKGFDKKSITFCSNFLLYQYARKARKGDTHHTTTGCLRNLFVNIFLISYNKIDYFRC